jgi:hypothetical protein
VFIRRSGSKTTGGKKAFGLLVGGQVWSTLFVSIGFVDAKTGEALAYSQAICVGEYLKDPEKSLTKPVNKSFKKIPKASA